MGLTVLNLKSVILQNPKLLIKYGKKIGGADVIFDKDDDSILLGALTLESLGLSID